MCDISSWQTKVAKAATPATNASGPAAANVKQEPASAEKMTNVSSTPPAKKIKVEQEAMEEGETKDGKYSIGECRVKGQQSPNIITVGKGSCKKKFSLQQRQNINQHHQFAEFCHFQYVCKKLFVLCN